MHLGTRRTPPQQHRSTHDTRSHAAFSRRMRSELRGWNLPLTGITERPLYLAILDANHPRHLTPDQDWDPQVVHQAERRYHKTLRLVTNAHDRRLRAERSGTDDEMINVRRLLHSTKLSSASVAGLVDTMRAESPSTVPNELFDELASYCAGLTKHHGKPRRSPGGKFARRLCSAVRELSHAPEKVAA